MATTRPSHVDLLFINGPVLTLDPGVPLPPILIPLSLNLILCAAEVLPRGGRITLAVAPRGDGVGLDIEALGDTIKLEDQMRRSLAGASDLATLDARSITPFLVARLVARGDGVLDISHSETSVLFAATLPHGA
jgi:histidine phosphotransferase ChpT